MIVTESPLYLDKRDGNNEPDGHGRSSGVHLSGIISYIGRELGEGWTAIDEQTFEQRQDMNARVEMGFIWEQLVSRAFKARMLKRRQCDVIVDVGEQHVDGIAMHPDAYDFSEHESGEGCVEEYKATWKSARGWEAETLYKKAWYWLVQIMGYCHAMGTHRARLIVYHVNGYYAKPLAPCFKLYEITFADQEIADNWQMLLNHQHLAKPEDWLNTAEAKAAAVVEEALKTHQVDAPLPDRPKPGSIGSWGG